MIVKPEPWMKQGACSGMDAAMFFPELGEHGDEAKQVCAVCPVQSDCLDYAVQIEDLHGIWAGLTYSARRTEQKRRGILNVPGTQIECSECGELFTIAGKNASRQRACSNACKIHRSRRLKYKEITV